MAVMVKLPSALLGLAKPVHPAAWSWRKLSVGNATAAAAKASGRSVKANIMMSVLRR